MRTSLAASMRLLPAWVLFLLLSAAGASPARAVANAPGFDTTFVQFTTENAAWPRERWEALLDSLARAGVKRLVVQWSVLGDVSFFGHPAGQGADGNPGRKPEHKPAYGVLESVAAAAEARGMTLILGLDSDPRWWERIESVPESLAVYLDTLLARRLDTARRLAGIFRDRPCLEGWYVGEELDDVTWKSAPKRAVLANYLKRLRAGLAALDPGRRVWISCFANASMSPQAYKLFLGGILTESGIDGLMFQDGVGVGKLKVDEVPPYMKSAAWASGQAGAAFMPIVEVFEQTSGPPIDDKPFEAKPARFSRVREQLLFAATFGGSIAAFSMPEYASPFSTPDALKFYEGYLQFLNSFIPVTR